MNTSQRLTVGLLTASVAKSAGGVLVAVNQIAEQLNRGTQLSALVFGGHDNPEAIDRSEWPHTEVRSFPFYGPRAFGYQAGLLSALSDCGIDLLHVHGLWMYPSVVGVTWARRRRPYLVSPHGMLDPWAMQNSRWKKRVAAWLYEDKHLQGATCLHALNDAELAAIRGQQLRVPVAVIPNAVSVPDEVSNSLGTPAWATRIPADAKVLLFMGRLHPKKGLEKLVRAWSRVRDDSTRAHDDWRLVIAGWSEMGHGDVIRKLAIELGVDDTVHLVGSVFGHEKKESFLRASAYILPSLSEGLPMGVLEAWSYGLPTLITDECHLPEGIEAGAALRVEPDEESIREGLHQLFQLSDSARRDIGANGRALIARNYSCERIADEMAALYRWMSGCGPRPSTVRE